MSLHSNQMKSPLAQILEFTKQPHWKSKINWPVTLFMMINPVVGILGSAIYFYFYGWSWGLFWFGLVFAALTNLSITAGYHRHFSHKSYDAHPIVQFLYLFIGASAWQGSALKWSSDHRIHHSHVDTHKDPYNIHRGFWFAHMGWLFLKETVDLEIHAPDLIKNKMVKHQNDHYLYWAIGTSYILPMLIGYLAFDTALGGLLVAGSLRIVLTQQSTFFVNSLCHTLGQRTYCTRISARDSWFVAILTHGEGYHNFHHKFQIDYRNGIKWYHWDPTKWVILTLKSLGLAWKLRQVPSTEILKARLQVDSERLQSQGYCADHLASMREKILEAQVRIKKLKEDYDFKKASYQESYTILKKQYQDAFLSKKEELTAELEKVKKDIAQAQLEFQVGMDLWRGYLKAI